MSLRLERIFGAPPVRAALLRAALALALAAAMLAVSPEAAEARTGDEGAPTVVVRPGDSLWSISAERLGPNASPRRVMKGTERIHELNRERIGADPDLVFVGQELSIPRAMSGPPNGAKGPARKAAEASGYDPRDWGAKGPARKAAEALGYVPRDWAAKGPARKAAEASGQGAIPRSEISLEEASLEEAAEMLGADAAGKEALPDQRADAPGPAARMVASGDAQPWSFFGFSADVSAEGRRRLLGLGIMALTLVAAALIVAHGLGYFRGGARRRDLGFREAYGSPYAAFEPLAGPEDAPRRVPEARDRTASFDGPTNEGIVSEDRLDLTDPFVLARAKRAQVRRQSPRPRPRGLRRPVWTRAQRRPSSGRREATARARHREWEPGAALVRILERLHLAPGAGPSENLAGLEPHLEEALGALERLERLRGLSQREKTQREALVALRAAVERGE